MALGMIKVAPIGTNWHQHNMTKKRTFQDKTKKIVCPLGETSLLRDTVAPKWCQIGATPKPVDNS